MLADEEKPKYYDEYLAIWNAKDYQNDEIDFDKKYEELSIVMEKYAKLNKHFITIYNLKKQKTLFISDNYVEVLGYSISQEQFKRWSAFLWMRDLPIIQSYFMLELSIFYKKTVQPLLKPDGKAKSLTWYMHNFKLSAPNSHQRNIGLTCSALEITPSGKMEVILIVDKDLTSIIKDPECWWFDIRINDEITYSYHYLEKKFVNKSILSDREKEILLLAEKGFETKEIAEKLLISSHTVDKHRKNMLEHTGAKDTSMLIQICRMGKLI